MKYEIIIAWYPKNLKVVKQIIGICDNKEKAFKIIAYVAKTISGHQVIDYNCVELRKTKRSRIFGKIALIEHLDIPNRKYGPFRTHLVILGKPKNF